MSELYVIYVVLLYHVLLYYLTLSEGILPFRTGSNCVFSIQILQRIFDNRSEGRSMLEYILKRYGTMIKSSQIL